MKPNYQSLGGSEMPFMSYELCVISYVNKLSNDSSQVIVKNLTTKTSEKMKKIYYILTLLLCVYVQSANAQMGVNSTGQAPDAAAMLDVRSTNKGFLLPRLTTTQRNMMPAISNGLMIYNTSTNEVEVYRGLAGWVTASRMAVPFVVSGNTNGGNLSDGIINAFNTGTGPAISGQTSGVGVGAGLFQGGPGNGVYGQSNSANGVFAESNSGTGLFATSTSGSGISAVNNSSANATGKFVNNNSTGTSGRFEGSNGNGVFSVMSGMGWAVYGSSANGYGGFFQSDAFTGLEARSLSSYAIVASNTSATVPVAQFGNLSGGTALEVIASTALKITGAIKVAGGITAQPAFKITSSAGNTSTAYLTIPNTTLANNSTDIVMLTHAFGTYLNKPYGVYWNSTNWVIYVEDLTAMPLGTIFNVLVIKQ